MSYKVGTIVLMLVLLVKKRNQTDVSNNVVFYKSITYLSSFMP